MGNITHAYLCTISIRLVYKSTVVKPRIKHLNSNYVYVACIILCIKCIAVYIDTVCIP